MCIIYTVYEEAVIFDCPKPLPAYYYGNVIFDLHPLSQQHNQTTCYIKIR